MFNTDYQEIIQQLDTIDPIAYGKTRNDVKGAVTRLSPYISRGVISTRQVAEFVLNKGYDPRRIESFLKELAWRDYFQHVWLAKKDDIHHDVKQPQTGVLHHQIPLSVVEANTGIQAIDEGIDALYQTGYMHNHVRMYVAGICCNTGGSHWYHPAQWMYYHLLDADWSSNALSWQWVAGSFSHKKYIANQENINRYGHTHQRHTFLDHPYEVLSQWKCPDELKATIKVDLTTTLPPSDRFQFQPDLPTCLYHFYHLDSQWMKDTPANRILILEPSFFKQYPVSSKTIDFVLQLSKNIPGIHVFTGEFDDLLRSYELSPDRIHFREHPTVAHFRGIAHPRQWIFDDVTGYYPSFFAFWKKGEKKWR
jgi:deoxyribodipyrimidine photo-lyase